jgi:predicted aldo/keto reductase-like oxidoreductase
MYHDGESEKVLGRWLSAKDRGSYYLTTKLPMMMIGSLEQAEQIFEEQRSRLGEEYFDFYLLHALNKETFQKSLDMGILQYCEGLKAQGKIKHLGFSFHDDYGAFEYILQYRDWDVCQIQLNYADTKEQAGMRGYELAKERGIPLIVMEPVKGGSLAVLPDVIADEFRRIHPDRSLASWALRWVGSLPNAMVILSGMSTMEQVDDNLDTFEHLEVIDAVEQGVIDQAVKKIKQRVRNGCTACKYCMPCPTGVNIPQNFALWNEFAMFENTKDICFKWGAMFPDAERAKNCILCGECERKCPQGISIRDDLAVLQKELDVVLTAKDAF